MTEQVTDLEKSNEIWRKNRQIARRTDTETLIQLATMFGSEAAEREVSHNRIGNKKNVR